ncbi:hypothetical protein, partial [Streptomyces sp. NPDC007083]|uniref:hypothetical protein n=1 Tax=Streptomyces sp. NPDC007083 TaxID=3156913 RepID=UPI0033DCDEB5
RRERTPGGSSSACRRTGVGPARKRCGRSSCRIERVYTGESNAQGIMSAYLHQSSAVIPAKGKPELLTTESLLIGSESETGF